MIPSPLYEFAMAGAGVQWCTEFFQPSLSQSVSTGLAPGPETLLPPFEKGIRFIRHQWVTFNWVQFGLSLTTVAFMVVLSKFPSKANKI